jgi:myo-inositol 2-dehydrogenase / D-chiro-inositol 1-dehydrogenase
VAELRIGIVGAGWIAGTHAATIALRDDARVVASADVVPGRADYLDWRSMLAAEHLDALIVSTPPDTHRAVTLAAAQAGLAVYLEKPVAHAMEDALAILRAVRRSGIVCAVGYQYRAISFLDDLPRDAALLLGTGISDTADRAWLGHRARGGGMMLERASHLIDLERVVAGEVAGVTALEEGDRLAASLRFAGGAVGSVVVGRVAGGPGWRLDLVGTGAGTVSVELDPVFRACGAGLELVHEGPPPVERSLTRFVEAAVRRDPTAVFCSVPDGVATLAVALAAQDAAAAAQSALELSEPGEQRERRRARGRRPA